MKKLQQLRESRGIQWVGNGFPVHSIFSYGQDGVELDPFLLLDYAPPYEFPPGEERRGVGAHPHRGFETVTICYQGEIEHRDSSGGGGMIGPGDVQWMTAASGLLHDEFHSEAFVRTGGVFEMAQLWVNLPARDKTAVPGYQSILADQIPEVIAADGAAHVRVIAGEYANAHGPAKTFTPINLWDVRMDADTTLEIPLADGDTTALLIRGGRLGFEGPREAGGGALALFERAGDVIAVQAVEDTQFLVMSGTPLGEPIAGSGPFVMNTDAELRQAYEDAKSGNMGRL